MPGKATSSCCSQAARLLVEDGEFGVVNSGGEVNGAADGTRTRDPRRDRPVCTPLANGTVINAVAQDPAGNTSGPASVTVDAIAPPAPVIDPSNGVVISGTAEAGATVILTDGNGNPIGQVTAGITASGYASYATPTLGVGRITPPALSADTPKPDGG